MVGRCLHLLYVFKSDDGGALVAQVYDVCLHENRMGWFKDVNYDLGVLYGMFIIARFAYRVLFRCTAGMVSINAFRF